MITERRASEGPSIRMQLIPEKLTPEVIEDVKAEASEWEDRGVITSISWDKPYMEATNQLGNFSYPVMDIDEEQYTVNWMPNIGLGFQDFCLCLLASLVCFLGRWALPSLQGLVRDCKKFVFMSKPDFEKWAKGGGMEQPYLFHDLLLLLPAEDESGRFVELLADTIDYSGFSADSKKRDLPSIQSFLTFASRLQNHQAVETPEQKCLFAPVRLWWTISAVVPLRPVEFLVTPYDCLTGFNDGTWYLSLRRNRIKGTGRFKSYTIQEDFELVRYQVPQKIAACIQDYQEFAAGMGAEPCSLGTLFMPQLHYKGMGREMPGRSRYYTYANFNYALWRFQEEVLSMEYGYTIIHDRSASTNRKKGTTILDRILPGDTRHLSLLNAAWEGVQPHTLMEMARHASITQTYWYAANDSVLESCAAGRAYSENLDRNTPFSFIPSIGYRRAGKDSPFLDVGEGRCYSPSMNSAEPDAIDCIQSTGPNGELGWCAQCRYFRLHDGGIRFDPSRLVLDAQSDWELLLKTVEFYRKDILHEDSLISVFEKARSSINTLLDVVIRETGSTDQDGEGNGAV